MFTAAIDIEPADDFALAIKDAFKWFIINT